MEANKQLHKNKSMINDEYSGLDNSVLTKDNNKSIFLIILTLDDISDFNTTRGPSHKKGDRSDRNESFTKVDSNRSLLSKLVISIFIL